MLFPLHQRPSFDGVLLWGTLQLLFMTLWYTKTHVKIPCNWTRSPELRSHSCLPSWEREGKVLITAIEAGGKGKVTPQ